MLKAIHAARTSPRHGKKAMQVIEKLRGLRLRPLVATQPS
jgi:hypothetical protein